MLDTLGTTPVTATATITRLISTGTTEEAAIEKHKYWCLFLDGEAMWQGRYTRLEQALAAVVSRMRFTDEHTD